MVDAQIPTREPTDEEITKQTEIIVGELIGRKGALIPILQTLQELFGYLPETALKRTGELMKISYSEVAGVVSFYKYFSIVPRGKYLIRVCLGTSCYVRGGKEVLESLKNNLGIDIDETTEDRLFSLKVGRCFGACGLAPVIMINDDIYRRVKPSKVGEILQSYRVQEDTDD
ncbi:MAG: NAD(P)H-dependent oxidoreductase subunit E [Spirochaetales bacterium]|uniref:NAD(P)H-dependent oxidoreductase subunit E n=1 Tax=Candidatus Thalassospirochaeta sargassi TaxID=3119039 RepID=A0AAJ1IM02_9SPIO|nr:NAD(P)H-dependent oxidoreductase subunit E [Spirochaetales bacterium]